jgi:hypothetical protein
VARVVEAKDALSWTIHALRRKRFELEDVTNRRIGGFSERMSAKRAEIVSTGSEHHRRRDSCTRRPRRSSVNEVLGECLAALVDGETRGAQTEQAKKDGKRRRDRVKRSTQDWPGCRMFQAANKACVRAKHNSGR